MKDHRLWLKRRELLIYIAIFLYSVALFLKRVNLPINQNLLNKTMMLGTLIALANIIFDRKMNPKQWILTAVIGLLLLVDSLPTGNHELFYLFIIIWSCRNLEKRALMKYIFGIVLIMTLLTGYLTCLGIVKNDVFILNETRVRYGLGYNVWSILPFQFLALCFMYLYLTQKRVYIWKIGAMIVMAFAIGEVTDTSSSSMLTALGLLCLYATQFVHIKKWNKLKWLMWVPEILAGFSIMATFLYMRGNSFFVRLNAVLHYRFLYQALGFNDFGIGLFANPEYETSTDPETYFGIDNNYINLLIAWGIVALIVILFVYSYLIKYCIRMENIKLLIIIMIFVFTAIMRSRLLVLIEAEYLVCFSEAFKDKRLRDKKEYLFQ